MAIKCAVKNNASSAHQLDFQGSLLSLTRCVCSPQSDGLRPEVLFHFAETGWAYDCVS